MLLFAVFLSSSSSLLSFIISGLMMACVRCACFFQYDDVALNAQFCDHGAFTCLVYFHDRHHFRKNPDGRWLCRV